MPDRENFNETETRVKLINPALYALGWTEDLIRHEVTAGTVEIVEGQARRRTVDIDERKRIATENARPIKDRAKDKAQQSAQWSQRARDLKKAAAQDEAAIGEAEASAKDLMRQSRELAARAKDIEDAVYDLKAVNPNRKPTTDARPPEELIAIIKAKGEEIAGALAILEGLIGHTPQSTA